MTEVILFWYKLLVHRKLELLNFLDSVIKLISEKPLTAIHWVRESFPAPLVQNLSFIGFLFYAWQIFCS